MDLNKEPAKIIDSNKIWIDLLKKTHKDEILKYIKEYPHKQSIYIDFKKLDKTGYSQILNGEHLPDYILNNPDKAISDILCAIDTEFNPYITNTKKEYNLEKLNIRIFNLPKSIKIRDIRSEHIGKLIQIDGVITRQTAVKSRITHRLFKCLKCEIETPYIYQSYRESAVPLSCNECGSSRFEEIIDKSKKIDSQRLQVSETHDSVDGTDTPQYIEVDIKNDLCSTHTPGNRVTLTGVLRIYQKEKNGKKLQDCEYFLDCHAIHVLSSTFEDIEITSEDEDEIKEFAKNNDVLSEFSKSFAYSIYGYEKIKKSIILQAVGGNQKVKSDKGKKRGEIHVFLCTDPALSKTQLLLSASRLSPRSMFVNGKGTSGVGLTATVVKDQFSSDDWVLQAGAIPLCHKGICCVDEISTLDKNELGNFLEALESGTITVHKASIHSVLQAETTMLCAANPKMGRYDEYTSIAEQINMPPQLLSRFDLIFTLKDFVDKNKDENIATTMLIDELEDYNEEREYISEEFMRKYISYAKTKICPKLTKESMDMMTSYYVNARQKTGESFSITARQLDGIRRLSQAHAKIRLSNKVEPIDVTNAISLIEESIKDIATDNNGVVDIDKIMSGTSKVSRDLNNAILSYIKENLTTADNMKNVVNKKELLETLVANGHDRSKIEKRIDILKEEGTLLEPKYGYLRKI